MNSISTSISKIKRNPQRRLGLILLSACLFLLMGCQQAGAMDVQPYYRPLTASDFFADGRSARNLPAGTVPQTNQKADDPALTGMDDKGNFIAAIPVPVTNDLVKRGQQRFEIYCVVCHGVDGHANGKAVVNGFPKPPDLLSTDIKALTPGEIFNVIANGKGKMFSYGYRVKAPDRWAVIAYVRAMQLKDGHLTQDLTPAELQQLGK